MLNWTVRVSLLFAAWLMALDVMAGGHNGHSHGAQPNDHVRFVLNKGQWEPQVLLAADVPGGRVFLEQDRLTFSFCDTRDLHDRYFHRKDGDREQFVLDCHSYQMRFVGSNKQARIVPFGLEPDHNNYFLGNDPSKWASEVPIYTGVRYEGIYPGIDYVVRGTPSGLKYDFEVSPGADPSRIQLAYQGQDGLRLDGKGLAVLTTVTEVLDSTPVAFQGGAPVTCVFERKGDVISFGFPYGHDPAQPLLIDPTMVFSTYTGSNANNFGFSATYDDNGNLYAGGIAFGQGYPVTSGTFQVTYGGPTGGFDAAITKFSPAGNLLYSTYLGGSGNDQPHSMVVSSAGQLIVMGRTYSTNFPIISGSYDVSANGSCDIFVTKFSATGSSLIGSTYVGGAGEDALNVTTNYSQIGLHHNYGDDARGEVVVDDAGNIYVANCTKSTNFPTTPNAFRTSNSGQQDGCVFKLNSNLSTMIWSTYLGGAADDAAYGIKVDANSNVVVAGGTQSANFPATGGSYDNTFNGDVDGFIARLNSSGTAMLTGTYIGNAGYSQCYFIELDASDDVYVVGQKTGSWPITAGVWSTSSGGQFIMKFNPTLSTLVYSTQFGNNNSISNISPTAFLVDVCEYVYVAGWGGGTNFAGTTTGLPVTADAFQSSTDGSDLYILVLEKDAVSLDYATFVGGSVSNEHVDGGTSRFNKDAEIYHSVCAGCWGNSDFPTTPGAYSNQNNSSCNLACFKMELELPGVQADFQAFPSQTGCAPMNVQFTNSSVGAASYTWNFADPSSGAANTSTLFSPTHLYTAPGIYTVQLIAMDPNSCNLADTSYTTITVYPSPQASVSADTSICSGETVTLTASGGQNYLWTPVSGLSNPSASTTLASPLATTTYQVIVSLVGGCSDTVDVTVSLRPSPTAVTSPDTLICPGDSAFISASGGISYAWAPGATLNTPGSSGTWAQPGSSTNYVVTVTAANGCTDRDTVRVNVSTVQAQAGADIDLCIGSSVQLSATGGGTYQWSPPNALSATNIPNPVATPTVSTTYFLQVTDIYGCRDIDSIEITLHPLPLVGAGPDLIMCQQDSVGLQASGAITYQWSPPTSLSDPNIGNPWAFPMSSVTYVVIGTDQWGCRNSDSLSIEVLPAPQAVATGPSIICEDSLIQLQGSGGTNYFWTPTSAVSNPNIPNPIASIDSSTLFVLRVTANNGCDDMDSVYVRMVQTPVVEAGGDRIVCLGHPLNLFATGGDDYLWSTGHTGPRVIVYPGQDTTYWVTAYVEGCPSLPDTVNVTVDQVLPEAFFNASPDSGLVPLEVNFTNISSGAIRYDWLFGDGQGSTQMSPTHIYQDTGSFFARLVAFNGNGCSDTMVQKIIVGVDFTIYVPNAFTPNGDGTNDYFNTPWIGVKEFHIMIFDRWGMLIYESFDPDFRWHGVFKGQQCQEGVYTYVLEASGHLKQKAKRAGTVTLYR